MKEIHEGKLYNTDTAIKIAYGYDEFCYRKTLYKTKNGNFFYVSEQTVLGVVTSNCGMTPITVNEAAYYYNCLSNKLLDIVDVFNNIEEA